LQYLGTVNLNNKDIKYNMAVLYHWLLGEWCKDNQQNMLVWFW